MRTCKGDSSSCSSSSGCFIMENYHHFGFFKGKETWRKFKDSRLYFFRVSINGGRQLIMGRWIFVRFLTIDNRLVYADYNVSWVETFFNKSFFSYKAVRHISNIWCVCVCVSLASKRRSEKQDFSVLVSQPS